MKHEIEQAIRLGQQEQALRALKKIRVKDIPRQEALEYASFARRLRNFNLALRILNPIVRPKKVQSKPATSGEVIEYAASIRGLGSPSEAYELLDQIDTQMFPQVLLQKSFCLFAQWNYEKAVPLLYEYVSHPKLDDYARTIGEVNLSSALIGCERYTEAEPLLENILLKTKEHSYFKLEINCHEMLSQVEILHYQDYNQALARLNAAIRQYGNKKQDIDFLFLQKWQAIALSYRDGRLRNETQDIREAAIAISHWETLRDLDFHSAVINQDIEALSRIYFGTPFDSYRKKVSKHLPTDQLPAYKLFGNKSAKLTIDLESGDILGSTRKIPIGSQVHQLLIAFFRDFYRPIPVIKLFAQIYEGEFFDPDSSVNRVQQAIRQTRLFIKEASLPLQIVEHKGSYKVEFKEDLLVRIPSQLLPLDRIQIKIHWLSRKIEQKSFRAAEACRLFGMSQSNIQRLLATAEDQKIIEKKEAGKKCYYIFKKTG